MLALPGSRARPGQCCGAAKMPLPAAYVLAHPAINVFVSVYPFTDMRPVPFETWLLTTRVAALCSLRTMPLPPSRSPTPSLPLKAQEICNPACPAAQLFHLQACGYHVLLGVIWWMVLDQHAIRPRFLSEALAHSLSAYAEATTLWAGSAGIAGPDNSQVRRLSAAQSKCNAL